jgi:probable phosphoglycerate mutase
MSSIALPHRLIFIRHGETNWNAEGRLQGRQDIPINGRGRAQAVSAGKDALKYIKRTGIEDLHFVASPLHRTRETMELAREAMGLDPFAYETDPRLVELTFGDWEGLTWPEVKAREPNAATGREHNKWMYQPPKGESYAMLADRLRPWLETVTRDTLVVSHGGVARALMALIGGISTREAPISDIHQGRVLLFEAGKRAWL